MTVAVCEDQPEVRYTLSKILSELPMVKKIEVYSDMDMCLGDIDEGNYYDVVFMEVDWKQEKTGIDYGKTIYKMSPYTKLIYIAADVEKYIESIFLDGPKVSGLLKNPIDVIQVKKYMAQLEGDLKRTEGRLLIHYKGSNIAIPFQDIMYLESQLHKVNIVLQNKKYLCAGKLDEMGKRLGKQFMRCHKSYIVNMDYIHEFKGRKIYLKNGEEIAISKTCLETMKVGFAKYILGEGKINNCMYYFTQDKLGGEQ